MSIQSALNDVALSLGVDVASLSKLITFESGFNPLAKNPYSGARGLIQFMDSTARGMGFKNADDIVNQYPDTESQLRGPVLNYLSKYKPFGSPFPQSLYLSVFYPAYRYSSPDTAFSDIVRKQNPGINYVRDYVNFVEKKKLIIKYSVVGFFVPVVAFALGVTYLQLKRRWKDEKRGNRLKLGKCN